MRGKYPRIRSSRKIFPARAKILPASVALQFPCAARALIENTMDAPTRNRNVGKTRSVRVQPFHSAWSNWLNTCDQSPGSLTRIISAIVSPRSTSTDSTRCGFTTTRSAAACSGKTLVAIIAIIHDCTWPRQPFRGASSPSTVSIAAEAFLAGRTSSFTQLEVPPCLRTHSSNPPPCSARTTAGRLLSPSPRNSAPPRSSSPFRCFIPRSCRCRISCRQRSHSHAQLPRPLRPCTLKHVPQRQPRHPLLPRFAAHLSRPPLFIPPILRLTHPHSLLLTSATRILPCHPASTAQPPQART